MAVGIKTELPWGRTFEEYIEMFNLNLTDLAQKIVGCGDGVSNFNQRMREMGNWVVSCDPLYAKTTEEIRSFIAEHHNPAMPPTYRVEDSMWLYHTRRPFLDEFFEDFSLGKQEGRYLPHGLPRLPFASHQFDIALCSHFLFSDAGLGADFHYTSIREMLRVARQVRIFPIIDFNCQRSAFLGPILEKLLQEGFQSEILRVNYGFYRNGHELLVIQ
ncbi:MAG TPA: SAM-dependent methyltransferase [Bacillota bacterium]|nr:SAM-dependent methyltransferase [Bacillota bacterium]